MTAAPRKFWWGEFPSSSFENLDPEATIAVLPLAAVEQHGPHLPLCTDLAIMEGMLAASFALLPSGLNIRVLPIQPVGKSNEHIRFSGTLSLSATTLIAACTELGACVARTGIRKLVLVTSHGGNEEVIGIVARELREHLAMLAVRTSWSRFGLPPNLFSQEEQRIGIHGGDLETSLMLHFRPDLVDSAKAQNFASTYSRMEQDFALLRPTGPNAFSWLVADLNPAGVVGDASAATAEKGRLTAEHQARGFVQLLQDVRAVRLAEVLS